MRLFPLKFILILSLPFIFGQPFPHHHSQFGDPCDVSSPEETCEMSKGLACSYKTSRCVCWDIRTIYSIERKLCVGRAGEQCHFFGGERLCTENAYCLEDESLSPIPICLCVKGYFKGSTGSCVRKSKFGEFCDLSSKYPSSSSQSSPSSSSSLASGHPSSSMMMSSSFSSSSSCEPSLHCVNYSCQCESNQIYEPKRELCLSKAGHKCSKSLNNCVENAECSEKVWAFDHHSGDTKMVGHKCACKHGLKVTSQGFCAVEYGGSCETSSECYFGQMTCINGKCQCHPLSQVYDKRHKMCLNLVGTVCPSKENHDDENRHQNYLEDERSRAEAVRVNPGVVYQYENPSSASSKAPSPVAYGGASRPVIIVSTSTSPPKTTTEREGVVVAEKSGNASSRNFDFGFRYNLSSRPNPKSFSHNIYPRQNYYSYEFQPELRNLEEKQEISPCVPHAECVPEFGSPDYVCKCRNGSSETVMRTCLLDYDQPCGKNGEGDKDNEGTYNTPFCNVFEGLACISDKGICQCADPMLVYDEETQSCLSNVGNICGKIKLDSMLLNSINTEMNEMAFYHYQPEQFAYINCVTNATCVDKSVNGHFKQVCVPRGKFAPNKFGFGA
ncbi:unnamed protein product [Orchesella dallaii]|uniref:EGF-like domain-containing protein n=1 Tax=Orchesella dallaii TaxID=48710 RepID=A0ABP1QHX9_9HEXA